MLALAVLAPASSEGATVYKKKTVVDFEEALIEGKSRKPYSAYLYQQKAPDASALAEWQLDFQKRAGMSRTKIENPL